MWGVFHLLQASFFPYSSQQSFMIGGVYPGPLNEFGTDQTSP